VNVIEFVRQESEGDGSGVAVNIRVDGRLLSDIIKQIELPMATAEGSPSIAGGYASIPLPSHPEDYYLGKHEQCWGQNGSKSLLLDCSCGCPGCWPLLCSIELKDGVVTWKDFEQPHRGMTPGSRHWEYSGFEGFVFDESQYRNALGVLRGAA
jgi:hypothetical protein